MQSIAYRSHGGGGRVERMIEPPTPTVPFQYVVDCGRCTARAAAERSLPHNRQGNLAQFERL
jgi:hypothetical protein